MEQPPIEIRRLSRTEAQQLVRGARGDPKLAETLRKELAALAEHSNDAFALTLPPETPYATMKARVQRPAKRLGLTLTIRRTPEGMLVWQETEEERQEREARSARRGAQKIP